MVGYIKHHFFVRYRAFDSWAHLNQLAEQWLREEADQRRHGMKTRLRDSSWTNRSFRPVRESGHEVLGPGGVGFLGIRTRGGVLLKLEVEGDYPHGLDLPTRSNEATQGGPHGVPAHYAFWQ